MKNNPHNLDFKPFVNRAVEQEQFRRVDSLHRTKIERAQSQFQSTQLVQRQMTKQESLLQNLQNTHHLDNLKLRQKNDQFLNNLKNIMNRKNMFMNGGHEQDKYDDYLCGREEHTYSLRKQKLKEISYQNLNILNRIRNVKSVISNDKMAQDYQYQKSYSKHSSRFGKRVLRNHDTSKPRLNLTETKRPFSLPRPTHHSPDKKEPKDDMILFMGNVQIKQQLYKVKLQKKKTYFLIEFRLDDYHQNQGNTARQTFSTNEHRQQSLEIPDALGFQLMSEHDYQYDKICGYIVYKHLFRNEKFDVSSDSSSAKFNRIIKQEFRNSQRKHYLQTRISTQQQLHDKDQDGYKHDCSQCQQEKAEKQEQQDINDRLEEESSRATHKDKERDRASTKRNHQDTHQDSQQQLHTYH